MITLECSVVAVEGMLASGPPFLSPLFCFHSINRGGFGRPTPPSHFNNNKAPDASSQAYTPCPTPPAAWFYPVEVLGCSGCGRVLRGAIGGVVLNVYISSETIGSEGVNCHNPGCGGSSLANARCSTFLHFNFPLFPHRMSPPSARRQALQTLLSAWQPL